MNGKNHQRHPSGSDQSGKARIRETSTSRKLEAAERRAALLQGKSATTTLSAATQRKLARAAGMQVPTQPNTPTNERRELERLERQNRLKAGGSRYREVLMRIGLGEVDTATVLIFGFTTLTMLVIPLVAILSG